MMMRRCKTQTNKSRTLILHRHLFLFLTFILTDKRNNLIFITRALAEAWHVTRNPPDHMPASVCLLQAVSSHAARGSSTSARDRRRRSSSAQTTPHISHPGQRGTLLIRVLLLHCRSSSLPFLPDCFLLLFFLCLFQFQIDDSNVKALERLFRSSR